jgi:hypothetical protein
VGWGLWLGGGGRGAVAGWGGEGMLVLAPFMEDGTLT